MMRPETARCENCVYWCPPSSECRRDPPTTYLFDEGSEPVSIWPNTSPNSWCGNFNDDWNRTDDTRQEKF